MTAHLGNPVKVLDGLELYYIGDIAVIVMDRGENRLNKQLLQQFGELLDDVERNTSCKGLITTGKGRFYGNGLDLQWLGTISFDQQKQFLHIFNETVLRLLLFPLPTLAAINGHAFAGAAVLALAHDLRAQRQDKGWFCLNEVWIKRQFPKYLHVLMRTKIGWGANYTHAVVLGKRYTGTDAFNAGIVHAVPSETSLLSESIHLLKSFYGKSGYPRTSLRLMKTDVYSGVLSQHELDQANLGEYAQKIVGAPSRL